MFNAIVTINYYCIGGDDWDVDADVECLNVLISSDSLA